MPSSSVFIFLMIRAIYGPKCKHSKKLFGRKSLNVTFVKLFSKYFFQSFLDFLMPFWFGPLIKGKYIPICWFVTFYCLTMVQKFLKKITKEQEKFAYLTVDGVHHQKNKN